MLGRPGRCLSGDLAAMDEEEESQDQRDAFCSIGLEVWRFAVAEFHEPGELAKLVLILFLTSPRKFQF